GGRDRGALRDHATAWRKRGGRIGETSAEGSQCCAFSDARCSRRAVAAAFETPPCRGPRQQTNASRRRRFFAIVRHLQDVSAANPSGGPLGLPDWNRTLVSR